MRKSQLTEEQIAHALRDAKGGRPVTKAIATDNGSEFGSKLLDQWAFVHGVLLDFNQARRHNDDCHAPRETYRSTRLKLPLRILSAHLLNIKDSPNGHRFVDMQRNVHATDAPTKVVKSTEHRIVGELARLPIGRSKELRQVAGYSVVAFLRGSLRAEQRIQTMQPRICERIEAIS